MATILESGRHIEFWGGQQPFLLTPCPQVYQGQLLVLASQSELLFCIFTTNIFSWNGLNKTTLLHRNQIKWDRSFSFILFLLKFEVEANASVPSPSYTPSKLSFRYAPLLLRYAPPTNSLRAARPNHGRSLRATCKIYCRLVPVCFLLDFLVIWGYDKY